MVANAVALFAIVAPSCALAVDFAAPQTVSGASGSELGSSAAISEDGTVAVLGAPDALSGAGEALVYARTGNAWQLAATLTPTGEVGTGHFGSSVAIDNSGQELIVGAPDDDSGIGAAWVFVLSGGTWTQQGELLAGASETGAGRAGASVAIANGGTNALVGAPDDDGGVGQAFTYYYDPTDGWYFYQHMNVSGVAAGAHFGASVALSNNASAALVGAPDDTGGGIVYPYSFFGLSSPYWIPKTPIDSPITGAGFGASLGISFRGDYDVIGAPAADSGAGEAFAYLPNGTEEAQLTDPDATPGDGFGTSVALDGEALDRLLVGAPGDSSAAGAAYEFVGSSGGSSWTLEGQVWPSAAPAAGDRYGSAIAIAADGPAAIVGSNGAGSDAGSVLLLTATADAAPDAPTDANAVAGAESATVSWLAPANSGGGPVTGYTVTASPGGATCLSTTLSCTVGGLTAGQAYSFTVTATNAFGTSLPSPASTPVTPQAPANQGGGSGSGGGAGSGGASGSGGGSGSNLGGISGGGAGTPSGSNIPPPAGPIRVSHRGRTQLTLSWSAPADATNVTRYLIYRARGSRWQLIGTTRAARRSFTVRRLTPGSRQRFAVRASDASGELSTALRVSTVTRA